MALARARGQRVAGLTLGFAARLLAMRAHKGHGAAMVLFPTTTAEFQAGWFMPPAAYSRRAGELAHLIRRRDVCGGWVMRVRQIPLDRRPVGNGWRWRR